MNSFATKIKAGLLSAAALAHMGLQADDLLAEKPKTKVLATIGMVADVARNVGGDLVEVTQLMGPGVDPHLYKPTPADARALQQADVIFYSGLMLEGRMADLFARIGRSGKKVYAITESVDESRLLEPEEFEGHYDPHVWFDVELWAQTVPAVLAALKEAAPHNADFFIKNAEQYTDRMMALHEWVKEQASTLPEERRILVTSHDAFNYFGEAYGFRVIALQGVSTVSEASLADMSVLVGEIKSTGVPAIFVETSVNPAAINRVAKEAGVKIGGELFSDAMGELGEMHDGFDTGTYEGMIRYNVTTIVNALKE